jgi:hypothetical protein
MKFTFDQFVHYGIHHGGNVVNGMPWSFSFYGHAVTHETDDHYLISGKSGAQYNFRRGDSIAVNADGIPTISSPVNDIEVRK